MRCMIVGCVSSRRTPSRRLGSGGSSARALEEPSAPSRDPPSPRAPSSRPRPRSGARSGSRPAGSRAQTPTTSSGERQRRRSPIPPPARQLGEQERDRNAKSTNQPSPFQRWSRARGASSCAITTRSRAGSARRAGCPRERRASTGRALGLGVRLRRQVAHLLDVDGRRPPPPARERLDRLRASAGLERRWTPASGTRMTTITRTAERRRSAHRQPPEPRKRRASP